MGETSFFRPQNTNGRALVALFVVLVVLPALAAWLSEWSLFSFPLGTFLVGLGVPAGLIAIACVVARAPEDETLDP